MGKWTLILHFSTYLGYICRHFHTFLLSICSSVFVDVSCCTVSVVEMSVFCLFVFQCLNAIHDHCIFICIFCNCCCFCVLHNYAGVSAEVANILMRKNSSVGTPFWMAPEASCVLTLEYSEILLCSRDFRPLFPEEGRRTFDFMSEGFQKSGSSTPILWHWHIKLSTLSVSQVYLPSTSSVHG